MKRIDEYNNTYNKKIGISVLIIIIITFAVGLIYFPIYITKVINIIREDALGHLKDISSQNVIMIENTLKEKRKTFYLLSKRIEKERKYNIDDLIDEFKLYIKEENLYNMGIIDKNGICYTTLGEELDLSRYSYFTDGMKGISTITNSYLSENGKELLNILTMPIYKDGNVEMVLTVSYRSIDFAKIFNISSFDEIGHSICIDSEGKLITGGIQSKEGSLKEEYYDNGNREKIARTIATIIRNKEAECINFEYDGKKYKAYYEPMTINDWKLVSYVPMEYIYNNINTIAVILFKSGILIYIGFIVLGFIVLREHVKYKKKMTQLVFFDELTKEKNYDYLKLLYENMSEQERKEKSLVIADIDKFKSVNIICGSNTGDELLKYIVEIFNETLPDDEIFRSQADIFVFIFNSTVKDEIVNKINKLENRIKEDIEKGLIVPINLSFGICSLNEFSDIVSIYNNALIAKNIAKETINENIRFFNESDKSRLIENRDIEFSFVDALKNNEFEVWYQPKYNGKTGEIFGSEALVRWRKRDGNFIFPSSFIPVFENTGQIVQLDEFVIEKVFKDMKEMKLLGFDIKPISINLSRIQATNPGLIKKIRQLAKKYEVDTPKVSFEITESAVVDDSNVISKLIDDLHEMKFTIDIDDYGIGSSTLNSIFSYNFDTLKLDKIFADNIGNPKMEAIIKCTIEMANKLNMVVIAEGVESKEQVDFLIENNCSIIQGYYYSKPLVKEEYFNLLRNEKLDK